MGVRKTKIVSFYSYKGGVGRTQLLTNLATYLCYYEEMRILLIDWDLEAPGLDFYFHKGEKRQLIKRGVIDILDEYVKNIDELEKSENPKFPFFNAKDIISLIKPQSELGESSGTVDWIPAGGYRDEKGTKEYTKKTIYFDWLKFYEDLQGKYYIEFFKEELKKLDYDFIFIDSRTGINDYSGICNIQLPDMNVLVVAPTQQNISGCVIMARNIIESNYVKDNVFRQPFVFPILARLETDKIAEPQYWVNLFANNFAFLFSKNNSIEESHIKSFISQYVELNMIRYDKSMANGEKIAFSREKAIDNYTIQGVIKNIAEIINNTDSIIQNLQNIFSQSDKKPKVDKELLTKFIEENNFVAFFDYFEKNEYLIDRMDYSLLSQLRHEYIGGYDSSRGINFRSRLRAFLATIA
jgi:MinD-like ATPase involved in chromosome partitioning or flagellar assembly